MNNRGKEPERPFLPDLRDSMSYNDFRMYRLKVLPCPWPDHCNNWAQCPFFHPGENSRRRDPLKHLYASIPCPAFREGACEYGDMCGYAHGVFESGLHPAYYRTQKCVHDQKCARQVCFYAHSPEELRPSDSWRRPFVQGLHLPPDMASSSQPHANLVDQFLSQCSLSHRFADQTVVAYGVSSPIHISAVGDQLQQPQTLVLPINNNILYPSNVEYRSWQAPFGPSVPPFGPSVPEELRPSDSWRRPFVQGLHLPPDMASSSQPHANLAPFGPSVPAVGSSGASRGSPVERVDDQTFPGGRLVELSVPTPVVSNMEEQFSSEFSLSARLADPVVPTGVSRSTQRSAVGSQLQRSRSLESPMNTNTFSRFGFSSTRLSTRSWDAASPSSSSFQANWTSRSVARVDDQAETKNDQASSSGLDD